MTDKQNRNAIYEERDISILEINPDKKDCKFYLNFSFHGKEYSFDTKMIHLPYSNRIFFSPVILKDKVLDFKQLKDVSVDVLCAVNKQKPIVWHEVELEIVHLNSDTTLYRFEGDYYGTEMNRRGCFRLLLGKSGEAQIGLHTVSIPVIVNDISASGISIISNEKREEKEIHIVFQDKEIESHFSIKANIVRVAQIENGRYLYGCSFGGRKEEFEEYIQKRQRYDLHCRSDQLKS